ncbi:acyl-CoA dehydrogenase family protein [Mycolicibacterium pyrenivorans]|uniref:acyl-CoA dehydrogenase family protein n=1 Tax=Mycolicibacterium pyrenivorans TaxID=187102 RepID=UPI0021F305D1|nr:acyl-CoA dehydrogenase family protein [Mycolicibacterium pyrenivorans]MCV7153725.1 acyl-CoA/acyl-ACP dehydrogenase [Mycolicibacterium pyrenivorans]
MNLELTDEQVALRDTVRRYLSKNAGVSDHVRTMLDDPRGTTDAVWRGLVDLGTTSLLIPADRGGDGMSMFEAGLVCEELGAALHPGPWVSSAVVAPRALTRFGADGERARELSAGIADGSVIATVAVPRDGTSFVADRREGGVTVRGEIDQVPDAAAADVLLVVGRGAELYAIPLSLPEVRLDEVFGIDKSRKTFRVAFDDAPAHLVAVADDMTNAGATEALLDDMMVAWAADALGAARQVLQMTVEYAEVRRQFGAPIGSFQAVAHLCVDMHETVQLARSGIIYALWAADFADRTERHLAALRVKAFAGRLATVGDLAIQVFGGIGFTWEHDAHLYLKRLLGFSRFLGSPGDYLEQVGHQLARSTG